MAVFVGLFYGKYFLQSALPCTAPCNDLSFFFQMKQFESIDSELAKQVILSIERHLNYLSQEIVVFALFDENLGYEERSAMAKQLAKTLVPSLFSLGKPKDPKNHMGKQQQT